MSLFTVFFTVKPNLPGTLVINYGILKSCEMFFSLFSPVVPVEEEGLYFQWNAYLFAFSLFNFSINIILKMEEFKY